MVPLSALSPLSRSVRGLKTKNQQSGIFRYYDKIIKAAHESHWNFTISHATNDITSIVEKQMIEIRKTMNRVTCKLKAISHIQNSLAKGIRE